MGQALYRKYRSKKMSEIVGQDHITSTLNSALKKNAISHAYLFTGPRGVGKTSIARILAHEVNGLPYDEETIHLDIIEIDAASNRRIDEIRDLRDKVHIAPTSSKYKVYIIDEVHMLTKEAFNALLKTLEEPPAHVIFILATTEAHKLPETIVSRTQRFTFKPVERSRAVEHLRYIADQEGIEISDDALGLIAEHGQGSFRDSISLLDQLGSTGAVVDLAAAQRALGIAPDQAIANLLDNVASGNISSLLQNLKQMAEQGYQAPQIAKQLAKQIRAEMLGKKTYMNLQSSAPLLKKLVDVPASHDPMALLEIILLEIALSRQEPGPQKTDSAQAQMPTEEENPTPPEEPIEPSPPQPPEPPAKPPAPPIEIETPPLPKTTAIDESSWNQVLQTLKQKHNTLYGVARMATPIWTEKDLTLVFGFPFHQKRLSDPKNKQILIDIITHQTGNSVNLNCIVEKKTAVQPKPPKPSDKPSPTDPLQTISNIFGSAEVLE